MRRKCVWLMLLTGIAALSVADAFGAAAPPEPSGHYSRVSNFRESWADSEHGWRLGGERSSTSGFPRVEATENAGAKWRVIFRAAPAQEVVRIVRTGMRAGLVEVAEVAGRRTRRLLITLAVGWREVEAYPRWPGGQGRAGPLGLDGVGRGVYYAGRDNGLYRLANWPSLNPRPRLLYRLTKPGWSFVGLEVVPGGVVALLESRDFDRELLVHRYGRTTRTRVPQPQLPTSRTCSTLLFSAAWPVVTIVTERSGPTYVCSKGAGMQQFVVVSPDGGVTWHTGGPDLPPSR